MPSNPQSISLLNESHYHNISKTISNTNNHGRSSYNQRSDRTTLSLLLSIPSESLTHITSFLDPNSLFALSRTNRILREHINDDNTWHSAFACQFLHEGPESQVWADRMESRLFRRSEDSWKKEFVYRCNLIRRWERSRNATVSHTPHYSSVTAMYLMPDQSHGPALLSTSIQYGIVARSHLLTGKVLKGYVGASTTNVGNGNPNIEFTPNISACAVTTEGWTAKCIWGYGNGEVAMTIGSRIMDAGRTQSRHIRCRVTDEHVGRISDVIWATGNAAALSAGADGTVRIWDAKHLACLWILLDDEGLVPDPCINVVADLEHGVIIATKESGSAVIWKGQFDVSPNFFVNTQINTIRPALRIPPPSTSVSPANVRRPVKLFLDPYSSGQSFGILYDDDDVFYRVTIELQALTWDRTTFKGGPLGPLTVLFPSFTASDEGESVVLAGDRLGRVSFFSWRGLSSTSADGATFIPSFGRLDAQDDGAITAIACNSHVIVTGSARGTTRVWDLLNLRLLRSFPSPAAKPSVGREWDPVSNILLERDLLVISVGSRVMTWKADPVKPHKAVKVKHTARNRGNGTAKWHKRLEIERDILEMRLATNEEHTYNEQSYQRQRAHAATLNNLGLSESEAVQYVLMLSREENEAKNTNTMTASDHLAPGDVFEDDFEDVASHLTVEQNRSGVDSSSRLETTATIVPTNDSDGRNYQLSLLGSTNVNVLAIPSSGPSTVMSGSSKSSDILAGSAPGSRNSGGIAIRASRSVPALESSHHFPAFESTTSSPPKMSTSSSLPAARAISWSDLLKRSEEDDYRLSSSRNSQSQYQCNAGSGSRSFWKQYASTSSTSSTRVSPVSAGMYGQQGSGVQTEDMEDADLKLALELSLAEVHSQRFKRSE